MKDEIRHNASTCVYRTCEWNVNVGITRKIILYYIISIGITTVCVNRNYAFMILS